MVRNRARIIETTSAGAGKPYEDSRLELMYCVDVLGFWAKRAEQWLAEEREQFGRALKTVSRNMSPTRQF